MDRLEQELQESRISRNNAVTALIVAIIVAVVVGCIGFVVIGIHAYHTIDRLNDVLDIIISAMKTIPMQP